MEEWAALGYVDIKKHRIRKKLQAYDILIRSTFKSSSNSTIVDCSNGAFRNLQSIEARPGASMKLFAAHKLNRNISFSMSGSVPSSALASLSNSWAHSAALDATAILTELFNVLITMRPFGILGRILRGITSNYAGGSSANI